MATASLLLGVLSTPAPAGDITVNTTADGNVANGQCSLREAMQAHSKGAAHQGCAGITSRNTIIASSATTNGVASTGGDCQGAVLNLGNNIQFSPNSGCGTPAMYAGDPVLCPLVPAVGLWIPAVGRPARSAIVAG